MFLYGLHLFQLETDTCTATAIKLINKRKGINTGE
jgi:hypothetical protein